MTSLNMAESLLFSEVLVLDRPLGEVIQGKIVCSR